MNIQLRLIQGAIEELLRYQEAADKLPTPEEVMNDPNNPLAARMKFNEACDRIITDVLNPPPKPLTEWYPSNSKPIRDGWYMVRVPWLGRPLFKKCVAGQWYLGGLDEPDTDQDYQWRGLTSPQE